MNRKLLIVLLLLPLALFGVDQVFGSATDGGKEKKKAPQKAEQPAVEAQAPMEEVAPDDIELKESEVEEEIVWEMEAAPEKVVKVKGGKEKSRKESKLSQQEQRMVQALRELYKREVDDFWTDQDEELENQWRKRKRIGLWELSEKEQEFVTTKILDPIRSIDPSEYGVEKVMSRCPSGYRAKVFADSRGESREGVVFFSEGCMDYTLGFFQYDMAANRAEFILPDDLGLVSVEKYFELYEIAVG